MDVMRNLSDREINVYKSLLSTLAFISMEKELHVDVVRNLHDR